MNNGKNINNNRFNINNNNLHNHNDNINNKDKRIKFLMNCFFKGCFKLFVDVEV